MKKTRAFSRSVLIHCITAIFIEKVTSTHLLHSVFFFFSPVLFRGIHLIETNEEVCVFYEKLNIQGKSVLTVFDHRREAFMFTDSASSGKASLSLHDNRMRHVYNDGYCTF